MKAARQLTIAMLVVAVTIALYGSIHMLADPTGNSLGLPFYLLNGTQFADYTAPGWVILLGVGILGIVTILAIVKRVYRYHLYIIIQGIVICAIVITQMVLIGEEYLLQYLFLMMGMGIAILGALLSQSSTYGEEQKAAKARKKS